MILVIDNYDSFTHNLVQYVGELGHEPRVVRSDRLSVAEALDTAPAGIIISPGPGTPERAGISVELIRAAAGRLPLLGVCLGHQALGVAFGGRVVRADRLMHGKTGRVAHGADTLFADIPSPFTAMRYHSLVVEPESLPAALEITAWSDDRPLGAEIMALRHRELPLWGVQFHPESIGSEYGKKLLLNFLLTSSPVVA